MGKSSVITLRLTEEFKKDIAEKSKKMELSMSSYITMIIKKDLQNDKN